jgi:proteic killer suppression protein
MKQMKLRGRGKPKFVKTTDSKHNRKVFPNLITQDFRAYSPNSLWTSYITYIPTKEGWLYLCVVLDCFSITRRALKELDKAPSQVQIKYIAWVKLVEKTGLMETRKIKGFHDVPLVGDRKRQRSIRLNKQWRAIYVIKNEQIEIQFIEVLEVTAHDY